MAVHLLTGQSGKTIRPGKLYQSTLRCSCGLTFKARGRTPVTAEQNADKKFRTHLRI